MAARDSQLAADLNAGSTDKSQAQPVGEPSAVPSDEPNIEPAPESTPDFDYDPPGLTNADVEQTATAMRDASLLEDGIDVNADEEPVPASGGGGLPFANSNSPGADRQCTIRRVVACAGGCCPAAETKRRSLVP